MTRRGVVGVLACLLFFASAASAQEVNWEACPCDARLGTLAAIKIPEGFAFAGEDEVRKFLELTHNPPSGDELGVIVSQAEGDSWFVLFSYDPSGYVKDDEKQSIDADALLSSIREGNERGNEERRERGWGEIHVTGWQKPPFYDQRTNNLTWAMKARSDGGEVVNYSVRLLGRGGVMKADLVLGPEQLDAAVPQFNEMIGGFSYTSGNRYAEWRSGDKVAAYGLTALVAGGAGAAAAKSGLLGKLWKLIVAALVAVGAMVKKVFAALTSRKEPAGQQA
jgi:uncharacterized membrane-anchored protein